MLNSVSHPTTSLWPLCRTHPTPKSRCELRSNQMHDFFLLLLVLINSSSVFIAEERTFYEKKLYSFFQQILKSMSNTTNKLKVGSLIMLSFFAFFFCFKS